MPLNPSISDAVTKIGGRGKLAERWNISSQAVHDFIKKGYFPLDRAKDLATETGIPLRELVRSDIRAAMERNVADHLLSE